MMNVGERLRNSRQAAQQGHYEDALLGYIWFHDYALTHSPSLYSVRLSFALTFWVELGTMYPRALVALEDICDTKIARLKRGCGDLYLFHDVVAICHKLNREDRVRELFDELESAFPDLAIQCADLALPFLLKVSASDRTRNGHSSTKSR